MTWVRSCGGIPGGGIPPIGLVPAQLHLVRFVVVLHTGPADKRQPFAAKEKSGSRVAVHDLVLDLRYRCRAERDPTDWKMSTTW